MIETKIPKDIRKYKTKVIGPFAIRQAVTLSIILLLDIILYDMIFKPFGLSIDVDLYIWIAVDVLIGVIGFMEIRGEPFEKFMVGYIHYNILSPQKRTCSEKYVKPEGKKKKKYKEPEYKAYL